MFGNTSEFARTIENLEIWDTWTPTHRPGATGIGKTFEDQLGIVENNHQDADLLGTEIKAGRASSKALVTLFTRNPCTPTRALHGIVPVYGYPTEISLTDGGTATVPTFNTNFAVGRVTTFGSYRLTLRQEGQDVLLVDVTGADHEIARWRSPVLERIFRTKLPALSLLTSEVRLNDCAQEEFKLASASLYRGFDVDAFHRLVGEGTISVHCRVKGRPSGKGLRNRGCAFRIDRTHIHKLYEDVTPIGRGPH